MQSPYMMMWFCKANFADFADSRFAVLAALGTPEPKIFTRASYWGMSPHEVCVSCFSLCSCTGNCCRWLSACLRL